MLHGRCWRGLVIRVRLMSEYSAENPRRIRSFVRRSGRMTEGQSEGFKAHWAQYGLEADDGPTSPEKIFSRKAPCVLEIGFGMGDSLLKMAESNPQSDFIGIEVHTPGVGRLLAGVSELGLVNLCVYRDDAVRVLRDYMPDDCLDKVQLFFPDPWHKTRHHKRRLVQPEFLALLASKLKAGGLLHIATDWQDYAEHCIDVFERCPEWSNTAENGDYIPRPESRPETKFERRGKRLGHGVWDMVFKWDT